MSLELEDPKSLESPSTPTMITTVLEQFITTPLCDSDDNQSIETVVASNSIIEENILFLNPGTSDPSDYFNANVSSTTLQTIVEVVNPILVGDGTANEIAVTRMLSDDLSLPSFDVDDDEQEQLSLNDKMKNVLKELRENEKVRLSLSRSMEEDEDVEMMPEASASPTYEEKTGSIGTVFMVRERLINDFYDHEPSTNQENIDSCQVYSNPSVDEFLAHEIRHAAETLTLDLTRTNDNNINDDEDDEDTTDNTPTSPTKSLASDVANAAGGGGNKKRRRNKKSKAKK